MATDAEVMEQALAEGKTLVEALALVDAPAPVTPPAGEVPPGAPPPAAPPAAADDLSPYLERIPEELRDLVRPALADVLAQARAKTAGASDAEAQLAAMHKAFATNPQGALAFLAEHYKVRLPDGPGSGIPPAGQGAPAAPLQPTLDTEIAALKAQIAGASTMAEVADLTDRLTTLKVTQAVGAAVAPVAAAQLSQEEQRQMDRLRQDHPDIPVDALLPQIRRRQASLRERPYLTPEEGMWVELGPALAKEVRRLRGHAVRASSPAERAAAGTSGPGASAPVATGSLDPYSLSEKQLLALMQATGGVAPDR